MRRRPRFDPVVLLLCTLMLAASAIMAFLFIRPIWDATAWL